MAEKTETIPNVVKTTVPAEFTIKAGEIIVIFKTTNDYNNKSSHDTYKYTGTDFTELLAKDVGELIGSGTAGITLLKLAQDLAVGIAVDRGDEDAGDWS